MDGSLLAANSWYRQGLFNEKYFGVQEPSDPIIEAVLRGGEGCEIAV